MPHPPRYVQPVRALGRKTARAAAVTGRRRAEPDAAQARRTPAGEDPFKKGTVPAAHASARTPAGTKPAALRRTAPAAGIAPG
ncbi:hypothetical protein [Actinomadura bangladeshensis]|uniref:Uncharacterized protein n=1 Tax=Actinomadura bangladeshensis TaxID=453573 RepID=A0A4R4NI42_9ACTN|nr:hypothetical protein [Actinomadura bangladeshensis]TDC06532.1 hypothetical protein E1284_33710 [Actinomadura bangladeshensis]